MYKYSCPSDRIRPVSWGRNSQGDETFHTGPSTVTAFETWARAHHVWLSLNILNGSVVVKSPDSQRSICTSIKLMRKSAWSASTHSWDHAAWLKTSRTVKQTWLVNIICMLTLVFYLKAILMPLVFHPHYICKIVDMTFSGPRSENSSVEAVLITTTADFSDSFSKVPQTKALCHELAVCDRNLGKSNARRWDQRE